jgi:hypothetical protein
MTLKTTTREPCPWRTCRFEQEAQEPEPTFAFDNLDDLLLELASQVGGCRRDASDAIQRGLALIAEQAEVARG